MYLRKEEYQVNFYSPVMGQMVNTKNIRINADIA